MAGRQEGKAESIKVIQVRGDGGPNLGMTQWGGLRGWMMVSGPSGVRVMGRGPWRHVGVESAPCRGKSLLPAGWGGGL